MNFSLPRVFVSPVGNTLPTTGTTATLSASQLGVFLPSFAPATAVTAADAPFIFLAQGRPDDSLNLKSLKSDKIKASNVIEKYLITGSATVEQQEATLGGFSAACGETISVTVRAFSADLNTISSHGLTRTFTVNTPCCDCGEDPCTEIDPADLEALVSLLADKINADPILGKYVSAEATEDGADSLITLTGIAQPINASCDPTVNHFYYNGVTFRAWAYKGAPTTQDAIDFDSCDAIGEFTITQELVYPKGTAAQVRLDEYRYFSYSVPAFKRIYSDTNYNGLYNSNAVDGTIYDQFVIVANNPESPNTWSHAVNKDFTVILYVPQAQTAAVQAILEAALGEFDEK